MIEINEEKLNDLKIKSRENNIPIIQDDPLEIINNLLDKIKPNKILEIGTAVGYSAICFSRYLKDNSSKIITVEIDKNSALFAKKNIEDILGNKNKNLIEVYIANAEDFMKSINEMFDVVFIDAAKGQYMKYLEEALRLTKKGSYIIADNILFKGMVRGGYNKKKHRTAVTRLREYIRAVENNDILETKIIDIGDGLAISKRLN